MLVIVPVDVFFYKGEHLVAVVFLPNMPGVDSLDLHTPEEPFRCGVVRRAAFALVERIRPRWIMSSSHPGHR